MNISGLEYKKLTLDIIVIKHQPLIKIIGNVVIITIRVAAKKLTRN